MTDQSTTPAPQSTAFARAFIPGIVLGLVVGLFAGAVLGPMVGYKPAAKISPSAGEDVRLTPEQRRALEAPPAEQPQPTEPPEIVTPPAGDPAVPPPGGN